PLGLLECDIPDLAAVPARGGFHGFGVGRADRIEAQNAVAGFSCRLWERESGHARNFRILFGDAPSPSLAVPAKAGTRYKTFHYRGRLKHGLRLSPEKRTRDCSSGLL